ncbi:unnamed protein product [Cylicocyclus nassatus]|uniref:Uncharacterized protein n=1 Tax=Cylicocyclus nassatus TaxID=53992 RepID=A0AA36MEX4_CYLNA|nr:unnamed protein product [Cylicocyclus nassatus]
MQRDDRQDLYRLIDICILLNQFPIAETIDHQHHLQHDLLQLCSLKSETKYIDYATSVLMQMSSIIAPSEETKDSVTVTRLLCDLLQGPISRRSLILADLAANGFRTDALVLSIFLLGNDEITLKMKKQYAFMYENSLDDELKQILRGIRTGRMPIFNEGIFNIVDQVTAYRIIKIDFLLNENTISLREKLRTRLDLSKWIRLLICEGLAYREYELIRCLAEDATVSLYKYSLFFGMEQLTFTASIDLLIEAAAVVHYTKPDLSDFDEFDDEFTTVLGQTLENHPNGILAGLVERWSCKESVMEALHSDDVYFPKSCRSSIEHIADDLRESECLEKSRKGLMIFASDLAVSIFDALLGQPCQRVDVIAKNSTLKPNIGHVIVRRLCEGLLTDSNSRFAGVLHQLCAPILEEVPMEVPTAEDTPRQRHRRWKTN